MICIVGAGPVGSYAAYLLAKKGFNVAVFEEHKIIGKPVQCTGIVTSAIRKIVLPEESVVNRIRKMDIVSPGGRRLELNLRENIILDRTRFDQALAGMAEEAGARICTGHRFTGVFGNKAVFEAAGRKKRVAFERLVGADGPQSLVGRSIGSANKSFFAGAQARARVEHANRVEVFLGRGDFAWVVPESEDVVRIGLLTRKKTHALFTRFLGDYLGEGFEKKILERQGGLVPIYEPGKRASKGDVFLVGDAAGQVKATTGGGIVQGLMSAQALSKALDSGSSYEHAWRKAVGRELHVSLLARRVLDTLNPSNYDDLVGMCSKDSVRKVLERHDRDFIAGMLIEMVVKEPRFLKYAALLPRALKN